MSTMKSEPAVPSQQPPIEPPPSPSPLAPSPLAPSPTETSVVALPALASGVPVAVFGFAVVVTMLSLNNAGVIASGTLFVPVAMVVGFFAIGIGGLFEIRNGDLFGGTFGIAYAAFLLVTGVSLRFFAPAADASAADSAAFGVALGAWLLVWALISLIFTVAARLVNITALVAFALLTAVLLFAGLANIVGGEAAATLTKLSGWAGIVDGLASFWLAGGLLLNTMYGRDLLPLGAPAST